LLAGWLADWLAGWLAEAQTFSENKSSPASQEVPNLQNHNDHYRFLNSCHLIPILGQINPSDATPTYFFKRHFNIIFPTTPSSSKCLFSYRFPHQNLSRSSVPFHTCYTPRTTIVLLDCKSTNHEALLTISSTTFSLCPTTICLSYHSEQLPSTTEQNRSCCYQYSLCVQDVQTYRLLTR
jgi:hypothetical protein